MIRWNVRCHDCGHRGFAYVLAGDSYGRQLGRTSHHQLAEFNSWEDPSFDEVAELVHEMMRRSQGTSDCFRRVLAVACDPAPREGPMISRARYAARLAVRQTLATGQMIHLVVKPSICVTILTRGGNS